MTLVVLRGEILKSARYKAFWVIAVLLVIFVIFVEYQSSKFALSLAADRGDLVRVVEDSPDPQRRLMAELDLQRYDQRIRQASSAFTPSGGAIVALLMLATAPGFLMSLTIGCIAVGIEWRSATVHLWLTRRARRFDFLTVKVCTALLISCLISILLIASSVIASALLGAPNAAEKAQPIGLTQLSVAAVVSLVVGSSLGVAMTTIARSNFAGLGVAFGVLGADWAIAQSVPAVTRFTLTHSLWTLTRDAREALTPGGTVALWPESGAAQAFGLAIVILISAAVLILTVSSAWLRRAEIS